MALSTRLLGPVLRAAFEVQQQELREIVPRPDDEPTIEVPGPRPIRVLLVGGGSTAGFGVRSHALALTGQLARQIHELSSEGAVVDCHAGASVPLGRVMQDLGPDATRGYDAAVLLMSLADASSGIGTARWRHLVRNMVAALLAGDAMLVLTVVGSPSVRSPHSVSPLLGRLVGPHADDLNAITRKVVEEFPSAVYMDTPTRAGSPLHGGADEYRQIAVALADTLVPRVLERRASATP